VSYWRRATVSGRASETASTSKSNGLKVEQSLPRWTPAGHALGIRRATHGGRLRHTGDCCAPGGLCTNWWIASSLSGPGTTFQHACWWGRGPARRRTHASSRNDYQPPGCARKHRRCADQVYRGVLFVRSGLHVMRRLMFVREHGQRIDSMHQG
jgi:hypothetical protein